NNWSRAEINNYEPNEMSLNHQLYLRVEILLKSSVTKKISTNSTASISDEISVNAILIKISPELYTPLSRLTYILNFLSNSLPSRIFNHIYKEISKEIEDFLWERILMKS
ncbi:6471_t:CDS:1, partial [Ambispora leptoticha]